MKVAIDGGNGCGGAVAAPLMRELGPEVIELLTQDGRPLPVSPSGPPLLEENARYLQEAVTMQSAEIGIAYDGDGTAGARSTSTVA